MEGLMKGDVVVVPFPFSDLTRSKKRPAYVAADFKGDDCILCLITSSRHDDYSVSLANADFKEGHLHLNSMVRPNRLFTADKNIVLYKIGLVRRRKIKEIEDSIVKIIKQRS